MDPTDIRSSFLRQRRNLMTISVVNLFVSLAGIKLEELDVLGNKFAVQNPHYITVSLWVAFFYWLVRYFQLLHDTGNLGIQDKYRDMVNFPMLHFIHPKFEAYARAEMQSQQAPENAQFWVENMTWKSPPSMWLPLAARVLICKAKFSYQSNSGASIERSVATDWQLKPHYRMFVKSWFAGMWYVVCAW